METYKKAVYVAALGIQVHLLTSTLMISQSGFNALTSSLIDGNKKFQNDHLIYSLFVRIDTYIMYKSKGKYRESWMPHIMAWWPKRNCIDYSLQKSRIYRLFTYLLYILFQCGDHVWHCFPYIEQLLLFCISGSHVQWPKEMELLVWVICPSYNDGDSPPTSGTVQ